MSPAHLSASLSKAALRTVTSKWIMGMTCMEAWLGGRWLTFGGGHTHPKRKERQHAPPPSLYRATAGKRIAPRAEGSAAAQPLLRSSSRLGECNSQPARLVHSAVAFAVPCHAEAARVPSIRLCSIFSEKQRFHVHNAYLALQRVNSALLAGSKEYVSRALVASSTSYMLTRKRDPTARARSYT